MSELLSAAAEALGLPEALVQRSAEARARETGATVDQILGAWAGGEAMSGPSSDPGPGAAAEAPPETTQPSPQPAPETVDEAAPSVPAPLPSPAALPPQPSDEPLSAARPPVLVGAVDNPMTVLIASVGLFLAIALVGLAGPSLPVDAPGERTSAMSLSAGGEVGRDIYMSQGCGSCHTQMVRPIVSDVGLGAVTLNDSNQVLGIRRFGPDLADIGSRKSGSELEAIVSGLGSHPPFSLSDADLADLVSYLLESSTSVSG